MAAGAMAPSSIELSGAPDELIDTSEAKSSAVQVMQIELTQGVLDELLQCTRSGKPPQILFGRNPVGTRDTAIGQDMAMSSPNSILMMLF